VVGREDRKAPPRVGRGECRRATADGDGAAAVGVHVDDGALERRLDERREGELERRARRVGVSGVEMSGEDESRADGQLRGQRLAIQEVAGVGKAALFEQLTPGEQRVVARDDP
jgi:hypothetical protein